MQTISEGSHLGYDSNLSHPLIVLEQHAIVAGREVVGKGIGIHDRASTLRQNFDGLPQKLYLDLFDFVEAELTKYASHTVFKIFLNGYV